jgi:hypothetical protein
MTKPNIPADRHSTFAVFRDDDRYRYGGFFYNNSDDPAVFVLTRFGLGWTDEDPAVEKAYVLFERMLYSSYQGIEYPAESSIHGQPSIFRHIKLDIASVEKRGNLVL